MLRKAHLNESVGVLDKIYTNFKMPGKNGKEEIFPEFCQGFCQINEPVRQFYVSGIYKLYFKEWLNTYFIFSERFPHSRRSII